MSVKGPAEALARIAEIVEGVTALGYRRSEKRITSLVETNYTASAIERRFWIGVKSMADVALVSGNLLDAKYECEVEISRHFGGGDLLGKEYYSLNRAMSEECAILMDSIMYPQNWDYSTTGLYLVGMDSPWDESLADIERQIMVWSAKLTLYIRRLSTHVAVA